MPPSIRSCFPKRPRWSTPSTSSPWPTAPSTPSAGGSRSNNWVIGAGVTTRSIGLADCCSGARRSSSEEATARLASLLELGDPGAEVAIAYRVKERLRDFYRCSDPDEAEAMLLELQSHCTKKAMPPEIRRLGRTIKNWFDKITNYHLARVSNGPTEALNNLIKRIKRIGFGFRNFENYRIRALLYAGKPNWRVLGSIVVR